MSSSNITNEEKRRIANERQNAVRKAWKAESERVSNGVGTRAWSQREQEEILKRGSVRGYEGHHMKSVSLFPQYAGEPKNIQFLTEDEHLYGAHKGSYHNLTNGYYDPYKEKMIEFQGEELPEIPTVKLEQTEENALKNEIINSYDENEQISGSKDNERNLEESNGYEV